MRTYGRLSAAQTQPVTYDLGLSSWVLDGLSETTGQTDPAGGTSAVLFTANASNPVAFGPGLALPKKARAEYQMLSLPQNAIWASWVVDYLDASGAAVYSDTLSLNYSTLAVDTSLAVNGASLSAVLTPQGWYEMTLTLPGSFPAGVVGTQLEYWPVGVTPSKVTYGTAATAYAATYSITPNTWVEITTDSNGYNDSVYLTTLAQCLKLNLGESPFYANYGIPQYQSVMTQVFPDYYTMQTQTQFAPNFASLVITRVPNAFPPVYNVTAVTHNGAVIGSTIPT